MKMSPISPVVLAGIIAAVASLAISALAGNTRANKVAPMSQAIDINLDEASAVRIAEVILVKVYGDKVLDQKPWKVKQDGDIFAIEGTLKTAKGGVASIRIRKTNAEVVAIIHGK